MVVGTSRLRTRSKLKRCKHDEASRFFDRGRFLAGRVRFYFAAVRSAGIGAVMVGQLCFECGMPAGALHHVVPRSLGGTATVPLCELCHGKAHHRNLTTKSLTKQALEKKKSRGERTGSVPFGYDLDPDGKKLVPNKDEIKTIELIKSLRSEGLTLRAIAEVLNSKKIRAKKGGRWMFTTVRGILQVKKATIQPLSPFGDGTRRDHPPAGFLF